MTIMNKHIAIPLLLILVLISSCDFNYKYSYTVTNSTDTIISIHIKTYELDSIYTLPKDINKIIYVTDHGEEGSGGPFFEDVNHDLNTFKVSKGLLSSKKNYLSNDSWTFNKGDYRTTIKNYDF